MHVCVFVYTYMYMYICMCVCMFRVCVNMCECVYVCVHMHEMYSVTTHPPYVQSNAVMFESMSEFKTMFSLMQSVSPCLV